MHTWKEGIDEATLVSSGHRGSSCSRVIVGVVVHVRSRSRSVVEVVKVEPLHHLVDVMTIADLGVPVPGVGGELDGPGLRASWHARRRPMQNGHGDSGTATV